MYSTYDYAYNGLLYLNNTTCFGEKVRIGRSIFGLLQAANNQAVAKVYPHVYPYIICIRFCVNLGGKFLSHYLTNKLIINTLVN